MAQRPKSLVVTKISKISACPDIWVTTILQEPPHIKFSTNFAVTIARFQAAHTMGVNYCLREKRKSFGFFSFLLPIVKSCQNNGVSLRKKPLNFIIMSLWDWLVAAWIYEEIFDDDSNDKSCDDTRGYDSSYDYDDYEGDF